MKSLFVFLICFFSSSLFAADALTKVISKPFRSITIPDTLFVTISPDVLKKGKSISVHITDKLEVIYYNTKFLYRDDTDFSWKGRTTSGAPNDYLFISTKKGASYGVIVYRNIRYTLRSVGNDVYEIAQKPTKGHTFHDDTMKLPPRKPIDLSSSKTLASSFSTQIPSPRSYKLRTTNDVVNILILYTPNYAAYYGASLAANIQYSIDYGNDAMTNSNIALTYNLAKTQLYDHADTDETSSISNALLHISGKYYYEDSGTTYIGSDISINESIRRLRADYDIDMTSLFRLNTEISAGGEVIGLGWMPNDDSRSGMRSASFNISEYSDDVFAHESGHNFGCAHSWDVDNCSGRLFDYSCGYDAGNFGTIMSYNLTNVIPYFSDPYITFNDTPIGKVEGDVEPAECARTIRETKGIVAINNDVSELNEAGDTIDGYSISGNIASEDDRDGYSVKLGGETTFTPSAYYYVNLYDEKGFLIKSFNATTVLNLTNGSYYVVAGNDDDSSNYFYSGTGGYSLNISTNYTEPQPTNTLSAIYLLLF